MSLLPVEDALTRLLDGAKPRPAETVALNRAAGRVLAADVKARRTQPPFDASAMDGYAVRWSDTATLPAKLKVIGQAPAGRPFQGKIGAGQAVRIFTGAPVPEGADTVVIQENTRAVPGAVEIVEATLKGRNIRARGLDFAEGDILLEKGRLIDPAALSLAAAGNNATLEVVGRPLVAIIATGDELLPPGSDPGPGQIIASNGYGVAAIAEQAGADVLDLGIAPDDVTAVSALVRRALAAKADVIVTLGGASVGDHDLVHEALTGEGMTLDFWKIAMRPGKPLMFGRLGATRCIGLPGNPVASLVCSLVFLKPLLASLSGAARSARLLEGELETPMSANDHRQDYIRAVVSETPRGLSAAPFPVQDSSMLRTMATANALIVREPHAPAAPAGAMCRLIRFR
ncbi:gephyrin-like molybdotransferase Glp [Arvimicrobium flavum]|uniref:molybdopterin molybdotransferase MoeA n=1 Tax=Arvimicrobium flavum TaxID=3393320 RepID=UPI00237A6536|nr:gephyrin-like molybdotransferase Glp [Mesorhizobium shangrilense]